MVELQEAQEPGKKSSWKFQIDKQRRGGGGGPEATASFQFAQNCLAFIGKTSLWVIVISRFYLGMFFGMHQLLPRKLTSSPTSQQQHTSTKLLICSSCYLVRRWGNQERKYASCSYPLIIHQCYVSYSVAKDEWDMNPDFKMCTVNLKR